MTKTLFLALVLATSFHTLKAQKTINVMTYNIRLNTSSDELNAWPHRKQALMQQVENHKADILSVQEALSDQMNDLTAGMSQYQHVGVGRDDGKDKGEFSAIFFLKKRFDVVKSGTFWLSETPDVPSRGWDAALNRICSWAELKDKKSGKHLLVFNTHFDHIGVKARAESAKLILSKIDELNKSGLPAILTGDFNLTPKEEPIQIVMKKLSDSRLVSAKKPVGTEGTFNGFKPDVTPTERIDFIFVNDHVKVLENSTLNELKPDGRVISDHYPVLSKLKLK